ncbi:MAG: hypothetical protein AB7L66_13845 [Gemmatimonadales bacterium]
MPRRIESWIALLGAVLALGCTTGPGDVAGRYHAEVFRLKAGTAAPIDLIAGGATIDLTLSADGTTAGTMAAPAIAGAEGTPFSENLTGSFLVRDGTVSFTLEADVFIRDLAWTIDGNRLRAESAEVSVVLAR